MQAVTMIRRYLKTPCVSIHATRLTVTGLGRAVWSMTTVKHAIKRMDRLLSNGQIQGEREQIQAALIHWILGRQTQPVIVADWSDLTADRRWQLLRAALPVGGRALILYEEVHPLKRLTNPQVHRAFLRTLHRLVPPGITPIVVTDAGFRAPWFREVDRIGWIFVGRVRNHVRFPEATDWVRSKSLYDRATATPARSGCCELVEGK
ncbi:MAG: IS4 family transposase [Nitrospira sp.]|nr:IS4 family transposase [Nitrospira sp.]